MQILRIERDLQLRRLGPDKSTRFAGSVLAILVALILFGSDSAGQDLATPRVETLRGKVQAVVEDDFGNHTSRISYSLQLDGLYVPIGTATVAVRTAARTGESITLVGSRINGIFYPQAEGVQEEILPVEAAPQAAVMGLWNVVIIPVSFTNAPTPVINKSNANQIITDRLKAFYQEASYGALSIQTDVVNPLTLNIPENCTDPNYFDTMVNAGIQAARAAGMDLSKYKSYMFVGTDALNLADPKQFCSSRATTSGAPGLIMVFVVGTNTTSILGDIPEHELGHNLGLNHVHSYNCGGVIYNPNVKCPIVEYGDLFDTMGLNLGPSPHFNSSYKELLGWLPSHGVTTTGVFEVFPIETPSSFARSLLVQPPLASDSFYVEYRQPVGFDADLRYRQVFNGPLIHLAGNPSFILNMHPLAGSSAGASDAEQLPGETYTDYANRFSITTLGASPSSARVQILMPGVNTPAALITSPENLSVVGGVVKVLVGALDRTGIARVTLARDGSTPLATLTAPPYQFLWDTTRESTGSHSLAATAYNAAGMTSTATISVTVRRPPTVTLLAPASAAVGGTVSLSAQCTADNAAIVSVEFIDFTTSLGLGRLTGPGVYTLNWGPQVVGLHSISARVTDSNGLTSISSTVIVTVTPPAPHISAGGVVGAGLSTPAVRSLSPNAIATVFGDAFGTDYPKATVLVNGRLPTTVDGLCVYVDGVRAPLFFLSATQINFQVPEVRSNGSVGVQVARFCGAPNELRSSIESVPVSTATPEFFYFKQTSDGKNPIAALNAINGNSIGPAGLIPGASFVPAVPGDILTLFFTGGGITDPMFAPGELPGVAANIPPPFGVTIAGNQIASSDILYIGVAPGFAGLYQLNMRVPVGTQPGNQPVVLSVRNGVSPVGYLLIGAVN